MKSPPFEVGIFCWCYVGAGVTVEWIGVWWRGWMIGVIRVMGVIGVIGDISVI
jgi:hypothetical protein